MFLNDIFPIFFLHISNTENLLIKFGAKNEKNVGSPHLSLDWGKIKIGSPKRTTGLKSLNFATFTVWTRKMREFSKLRFVCLKYVDNWSGNLHFFFHTDTAASTCSMKYRSSQLAHVWHTFIPWGLLGLIFAGYVPLAYQSPYPIVVYSVANYRLHIACFSLPEWQAVKMIFFAPWKSWKCDPIQQHIPINLFRVQRKSLLQLAIWASWS